MVNPKWYLHLAIVPKGLPNPGRLHLHHLSDQWECYLAELSRPGYRGLLWLSGDQRWTIRSRSSPGQTRWKCYSFSHPIQPPWSVDEVRTFWRNHIFANLDNSFTSFQISFRCQWKWEGISSSVLNNPGIIIRKQINILHSIEKGIIKWTLFGEIPN